MINCFEFLEKNIMINPDKIALIDPDTTLKYIDVYNISNNFAANISINYRDKPIVVIMRKSVWAVCAFMGIIYSGNFYVPLDCDMPFQKINIILNEINPDYVVVDSFTKKKFETDSTENRYSIINIEDICCNDKCVSNSFRRTNCDLKPVYMIYTSGSTGNPKGVVISHRGVIDYIEWAVKKFSFDNDTVFGNQAPFHFDNSIFDIYCTFASGGTMVIIPKIYFAFPKSLIEYMNKTRVNTIFWVPSAINSLNCVEKSNAHIQLDYIQRIMFCGEVMHNKLLNSIRSIYPSALYVNLYGPTEITDACTYYIVNREFLDDEPLPIGIPCENSKVFLIENGKAVAEDLIGEICVGGAGVAMGYYKNKELSDKVFTQNPLNNEFYERIYHTGDLGKFCDGNFYFVGRMDDQIKRNGYRIELGEIDSIMRLASSIKEVAAVYDADDDNIILFYSGDCEESALRKLACERLPLYMNPDVYIWKRSLPHKSNLKVDRKGLLNSEKKKNI